MKVYDDTGRCIGRMIVETDPRALTGLQWWSTHHAPVVIISMYRDDSSDAENAKAHHTALRALRKADVPCVGAQGQYKGKHEQSIIVRCDEEKHARYARILAGAREQESILVLDGTRAATLETPQGDHIADLGQLHAVSHAEADASDAYTFANGTYYVCKR